MAWPASGDFFCLFQTSFYHWKNHCFHVKWGIKKEWPSKNLTSLFFLGGSPASPCFYICKKLRVTKKKQQHTPRCHRCPRCQVVWRSQRWRHKENWNPRSWGAQGKTTGTNGEAQTISPKGKFGHQKNLGSGVRWKKARGRLSRYVLRVCGAHDVVKDPKKRAEGICYVEWSKNEGTGSDF